MTMINRIIVTGKNSTLPRFTARDMHLGSLTDEELLSWFKATRDNLVTTRLEEELASRLEAALDKIEDTDGLEKQIQQLEDDKEALEGKLSDLKEIING